MNGWTAYAMKDGSTFYDSDGDTSPDIQIKKDAQGDSWARSDGGWFRIKN
jgi:hypothetical protein